MLGELVLFRHWRDQRLVCGRVKVKYACGTLWVEYHDGGGRCCCTVSPDQIVRSE